ncbi:MAG: rod shape-determining protein [Lachnospiraceae bacterium]|jgi:rod shape-determining protein MreB|nr:rod shape-determining protein [Lachnospiraceae bacterium]MCI1397920.1 rod shape-determining protein [Lachnospiraceae bacterium]MCI1423996.1 rod shape-determining protein [Lachnospiraceae bacterium]MCI1452523.1 rod shape-determining protein [Lachnospiraceae bacterium]MDD5850294.1 rod shape-determining protein [Bacillota bacterium]
MRLFGRSQQEDAGRAGLLRGGEKNAFGIDLGTCNIKIFNNTTSRITTQKNMIAIQNRQTMIAYGDSAYEMFEKSPASIKVTSPIGGGVIADIQNMERLLNSLIRDQQRGQLRGADYYLTIPSDVTEVEKRSFYDLVKDSGIRARSVYAVDKAIADGLGLGIDINNSQGCLVVDVGYDTTEVSILSLGGIVLSKLLKTGGRAFDTAVITAVRREYNLIIGQRTAENARTLLSTTTGNKTSIPVFGRDIVTGLPMEKILKAEFVSAALKENFRSICDQVKVILERTPPELSADIYRNGIFLTGGACQQEGLADQLARTCQLDANVPDAPVETAARGLAQVIRKASCRNLAYTIEGLGNYG